MQIGLQGKRGQVSRLTRQKRNGIEKVDFPGGTRLKRKSKKRGTLRGSDLGASPGFRLRLPMTFGIILSRCHDRASLGLLLEPLQILCEDKGRGKKEQEKPPLVVGYVYCIKRSMLKITVVFQNSRAESYGSPFRQ